MTIVFRTWRSCQLARVRAWLAARGGGPRDSLSGPDLGLNSTQPRPVPAGPSRSPLSFKRFWVLRLLLANPRMVVTRRIS